MFQKFCLKYVCAYTYLCVYLYLDTNMQHMCFPINWYPPSEVDYSEILFKIMTIHNDYLAIFGNTSEFFPDVFEEQLEIYTIHRI